MIRSHATTADFHSSRPISQCVGTADKVSRLPGSLLMMMSH
jgi:hypothetical protein